MDTEIKEAIDTIHQIYKKEAKKAKILNPSFAPAGSEEVKAFEKKLGKKLPADFKDYLQANDRAIAFDHGFFALSMDEIITTWGALKAQLDEGLFDDKLKALQEKDHGNWSSGYIKHMFWTELWIPFAKDDAGNVKCIDLDPAKEGSKGQVLSVYTADGAGPFASDFDSFVSYLSEQDYLYEEKSYRLEQAADGGFRITLDSYANGILEQIDSIRKIYIKESKGGVGYRKLKPATEAGIRDFEKRLGVPVPKGLSVFLKHNDVAMGFDGGFEAIDLEQAIGLWEMMSEHLDNGVFDDGRIEHHLQEDFGNWKGDYIRQVWWSKRWIPFAEDGCGNMKCIDLDPGVNGESGQVTAMEIQDGQGPFATNYLSFDSYLEEQAELYKNKKYQVSRAAGSPPLIQLDSYS